ncbi:hypothetical protein Golax_005321 [Gossypium laxum]|uniref:Uncharacterized protein n=1 Tax=Gossypium laxum TaxID=34288 RepID=A0A7J9A1T1_9ROSI|nr:hypothetical protein [Gossypium laxum]
MQYFVVCLASSSSPKGLVS